MEDHNTRKLTVLFVSEPGSAGVKRHVIDTLGELANNFGDLDLYYVYSLTRSDSTYTNEIENLVSRGVTCIEIPMSRGLDFRSDIYALLKLKNLMRRIQPQIVHAHSSKAGFLTRLARIIAGSGSKLLYTPNAMSFYVSRKYRLIEEILARFTTTIIAVSKSEKLAIVEQGVASEVKVKVIPMGVYSSTPPPVKVRKKPLVIGACGRICRQKNAKLFFETAMVVMRQNKDISVRWIGDFSNDDESEYVRGIINDGEFSGRIEITGWVNDAISEMRKLDIFCMFSRYESFGFVTADAMLNGIPVVATREMGTVDLISAGRNGWIVDSEVTATSGALIEALNSYEEREKRSIVARNHIIENFQIDQCAKKLFDFYLNLV